MSPPYFDRTSPPPSPSCHLIDDHGGVLLFSWTVEGIPPHDVLPLPSVEVEQFRHKHVHRFRGPEHVTPSGDVAGVSSVHGVRFVDMKHVMVTWHACFNEESGRE